MTISPTTGRRFAVVLAVGALTACTPARPPPPPGASLSWAYPVAPEKPLPSAPPGDHRVPGSALVFTQAQLNDDENPVDWFPGEHPRPPEVVSHRHKGGPTPCAECHLYNGGGFLGAPSLAGLPAAYIVQQVQAFKSGERLSWQPERPATHEMIVVSRKTNDTELADAAAYFAALPRPSRVRVVESETAPVTSPNFYGWLDMAPGAGREPIKGRIIEVAEDFGEMMLGDAHSGIVAYAPVGSIARGEALVKSGGPAGQPCATCHGADLHGAGDVPPLAGRSPAYLARMLWDIKTGARGGPSVAAMTLPASRLSEAQITDIVAYLGSRKP